MNEYVKSGLFTSMISLPTCFLMSGSVICVFLIAGVGLGVDVMPSISELGFRTFVGWTLFIYLMGMVFLWSMVSVDYSNVKKVKP